MAAKMTPEERKAMFEESLNKMVTQGRAIRAARLLFPDEYADGSDCRMETGREGEPCRFCAERNVQWTARVAQVRDAMKEAFR